MVHHTPNIVTPNSRSTHLPKKRNMRSDSLVHALVFNIHNTMLEASLLYDFADGRIMNVRYFWEQVVLNLEVQSAHIP